MEDTQIKRVHYVLILILVIFSPLTGAVWVGLPFATYLEFPPRTQYIVHASFSPFVFIALLLFETAVYSLFFYRLLTYKYLIIKENKQIYSFPWWGWTGCALCVLSWVLSWNRFSFFAPLQRYTFFPLWAGFILVLNGLSFSRKNHCIMSRHPAAFLWLFPASALFWWYFEYLNRFVQNWYYPGSEDISRQEYIIHASICFSTVLPAVVSTCEYLRTFPLLLAPFKSMRPIRLPAPKGLGLLLLTGSVLALTFLAAFPDYLFPVVWLSPLFIIIGIQLLSGRTTILHCLERGDWQNIILPALAALTCGFFWEMWNWKSMARWEYSIPFVHRFEIFEMPLLGYAGYLPFGMECIVVAALLFPQVHAEINDSGS